MHMGHSYMVNQVYVSFFRVRFSGFVLFRCVALMQKIGKIMRGIAFMACDENKNYQKQRKYSIKTSNLNKLNYLLIIISMIIISMIIISMIIMEVTMIVILTLNSNKTITTDIK